MELIDYIDNYEGRAEVAVKADCDHCGDYYAQHDLHVFHEGNVPLFLCDDCNERYIEAQFERDECTCVQTDVDMFDVRGCLVHDHRRAA